MSWHFCTFLHNVSICLLCGSVKCLTQPGDVLTAVTYGMQHSVNWQLLKDRQGEKDCCSFSFESDYAALMTVIWSNVLMDSESKHLKKDQGDEVKGFEAYFSMEPEQGATPSLNSGRDWLAVGKA